MGLIADGIVGSKTVAKLNEKGSKGGSKGGSTTTPPAYDTNKTILGGLDRQMNIVTNSMELLNAQMSDMSKTSLEYRNAMKKQGISQVEILSLQKRQLAQEKVKKTNLEKQLRAYGDPSKLTGDKLEAYNNLQQEYDTNIEKINSLQVAVETSLNEISAKALEIFTSYISEIATKYNNYLKGFDSRIDDVQFKEEVRNVVDPDNKKMQLKNQTDIAIFAKQKQATAYNKKNAMEGQHDKAVKQYGYWSEQAVAVRAEMETAREEYESATLELLNAEKSIKDTRASIADEGIAKLKEYYGNMKSMATDAIDKQKEALQKAHDAEMKVYDEKITKINEVYDARIKDMDKAKSENEYQKGLDEKNKKKSELTNKIALLSRDNTVEGRKKTSDLQKELDELNKEISEYQADRADSQLRESLANQKDAQIETINKEKEGKQDALTGQLEELDKEKEAIAEKYDKLINNETHWADVRNQAITGSFTLLNTELGQMETQLNKMNKGIFDGLTSGFSGYSKAVQDEIKKTNELLIDNSILGSKDAISSAKQASQAPKYNTDSNGTVKTKGEKVEDPKKTTYTAPPKTTPKPNYAKETPTTPSKSTTPSKTPAKKDPNEGKKGYKKSPTTGQWIKDDDSFKSNDLLDPNRKKKGYVQAEDGSWVKESMYKDAYRQTTSNLNMRKSAGFGNNVMLTIPKGTKVQYLGMEKGWAKIGYNNKTGYVSTDYLKKFDTGGYTGNNVPKDGAMAILHNKELVLNERQTSDFLDMAKIMSNDIMPVIKKSNLAKNFIAQGGVNVTNHYELTVNVDNMNGTEKQAESVASVIMKGLKKMGK